MTLPGVETTALGPGEDKAIRPDLQRFLVDDIDNEDPYKMEEAS